MSTELMSQFYDAYRYSEIRRKYQMLIQRYADDISACEQKYLRIKNEKHSAVLGNVIIIVSAFFVFAFSGVLFSALQVDILGLFTFLLAPVLAIIAIIMNNKRVKQKRKRSEKEANTFWMQTGSPAVLSNQDTIKKIEKELYAFCAANESVMDIIPPNYREDFNAISYMANAVLNGRAESVKEAVNLYVEQLHRWEMEAGLQQISQQQGLIASRLSELNEQQRITNSKLSNIETLTFLDYIDNR